MRVKEKFLRTRKKKKRVRQGNQSTCISFGCSFPRKQNAMWHRGKWGLFSGAGLGKSGIGLWVIGCTDAKSESSLVTALVLGLRLHEHLSWARWWQAGIGLSATPPTVSPMLCPILTMVGCQEYLQTFLRVNQCLFKIIICGGFYKRA